MIEIQFKKNDENAYLIFERIFLRRNVVRCNGLLNRYITAPNNSEMIISDNKVYLTNRSNLILNTDYPGEEKLQWKEVLEWQNIPELKIKGKHVCSENIKDCFQILI